MTTIEDARAIAGSAPWLARASAEFRTAVLERCILQRFAAHETIYAVGDGPGGLHCVVTGSMRVSISSAESGPYFAHIMRPGTWIGEGPLISGQPRLVGVSAGRPSEILLLPLPAIQAILDANPIGWRSIALLSLTNLQTAILAANDLMIRDDTQRLVATLLRLAGRRHSSQTEAREPEVDLSQEDLAAMTNLARSTTSAILKRLADDGLITLDYRRIVLTKSDDLRALVMRD